MRKIFNVFVLAILTLSVHAYNTFGQVEPRAHYEKGKMVEISDLLWGEDAYNCSTETGKRYAGTVFAVQFTEGLQINNFTLKTRKGSFKIYISPSLYAKRISKQDATALPTLIAKGRRITVDTYPCGDARKIITAVYITAGIQLDVLG